MPESENITLGELRQLNVLKTGTDEVPLVWYNFTVKGIYANGNKARMHGRVQGPDVGMPPSEVFEAAVDICKRLSPGLVVDTAKSNQVILQKRRGK